MRTDEWTDGRTDRQTLQSLELPKNVFSMHS